MEGIAIALFLSVAVNRIIEAFTAPIKQKWPLLDMWWLLYVSWVVASLVVFASGVNLFGAYIPDIFIGRLLTALAAGGGANLLNDLFFGPASAAQDE